MSAALYVKFVPGALKNNLVITNDDLKFCDEKLGQVSRSFAAVIRQLPNDLAWDILIFYRNRRSPEPSLTCSHAPCV